MEQAKTEKGQAQKVKGQPASIERTIEIYLNNRELTRRLIAELVGYRDGGGLDRIIAKIRNAEKDAGIKNSRPYYHNTEFVYKHLGIDIEKEIKRLEQLRKIFGKAR